MANSYFQFKQFTVWHDRCAMKVSTDSALLGAWAPLPAAGRLLDAGCGSGLLALMAAQRVPSLQVVGVEIDPAAAEQAAQNMAASPWGSRMQALCADLLSVAFDRPFDAILCNPPYFAHSLLCPDDRRSTARHATGLNSDTFWPAAARLLAEQGTVALVLPADQRDRWVGSALMQGFRLFRQTAVHTRPAAPAKRCLLAFARDLRPLQADALSLSEPGRRYSERFARLMSPFYLHL